jgi:hypothetical protein
MTLGICASLITYIGLKRKSGGSRGVVTDAREVGHGSPAAGSRACQGIGGAAKGVGQGSHDAEGEAATPREKATGWVPCRRGGCRAEGEGRRVGAVPTRRPPHRGRRSVGGCCARRRMRWGGSGPAGEKDASGEAVHERCR